ncbi:MAG: MG2 domain-containing protein, partial [Pyrinomonadaceae bacterium]
LKRSTYATIKSYVRSQLQHDSRQSFNHKFRTRENVTRTPLNVSDYARVPLLNPNQLVSSWREPLPPLENEYDRRQIPLGKRSSGVYLVEAVAGDLRAYTIAVVTELTVVDKTTRNGELLVYTVDRRTGEPRRGAQVEIVKNKRTLASGVTDNQGILRTGIDKKLLKSEEENIDPATEDIDSRSFLILAKQQNDFAVSDLQSFYFLGYQGEEEPDNLKGYIYTDRPVYRPAQKIFFKGILRSIDEHGGYKPIKDQTTHVIVEDPNNARLFDQELTVSSRGTFSGELEIAEGAPLGSYQIIASADDGTASGNFQVAEYKKPEYKVKVSAPQRFVPAGSKTKFSIDARYFFGGAVANAEVKYY